MLIVSPPINIKHLGSVKTPHAQATLIVLSTTKKPNNDEQQLWLKAFLFRRYQIFNSIACHNIIWFMRCLKVTLYRSRERTKRQFAYLAAYTPNWIARNYKCWLQKYAHFVVETWSKTAKAFNQIIFRRRCEMHIMEMNCLRNVLRLENAC